jgi:3-phosphoglycerate kinase
MLHGWVVGVAGGERGRHRQGAVNEQCTAVLISNWGFRISRELSMLGGLIRTGRDPTVAASSEVMVG